MNKENYIKPICKIETFETVDVITTSAGGGYTDNETEIGGDLGDIW